MNLVVLIGRLTGSPELKQTSTNKDVVTFTLAINRLTGDEADFVNCVAWDKTALFITNYMAKGDRIGVQGRIQTRTYNKQDGSKGTITEVIVERAEFCDGKSRKPEMTNGETIPVESGFLPF